jgi:hypothetical protein
MLCYSKITGERVLNVSGKIRAFVQSILFFKFSAMIVLLRLNAVSCSSILDFGIMEPQKKKQFSQKLRPCQRLPMLWQLLP